MGRASCPPDAGFGWNRFHRRCGSCPRAAHPRPPAEVVKPLVVITTPRADPEAEPSVDADDHPHSGRVIERKGNVIHRPENLSAFEFVVLAGLRAAQLTRGCTPRVEGAHKIIMTAQMEVAAGRVVRVSDADIVAVK